MAAHLCIQMNSPDLNLPHRVKHLEGVVVGSLVVVVVILENVGALSNFADYTADIWNIPVDYMASAGIVVICQETCYRDYKLVVWNTLFEAC